jgi:hypothetical protein
LSLFPDSVISPQKTRIKITWWGDDPDGLIKGYRFSFDSINWTFTTKNDSTFQLAIIGNDSTFRFWVAAVDDKDAVDPTPATNLYPVINSPPNVSFNIGTEIPDTSFTVASFAWTGTDPDGDNTIKYYLWALNDTSTWHRIPGSINLLTLHEDSGIAANSNNVFYLKAEDIAGSFSRTVRMPDTNKTWFVRQPRGRVLLINDYFRTPPTDVQQAITFYESAMDTVIYSKLDIKTGNGSNIPKIVNPMFIETLKLFRVVVWFGNRSNVTSDNTNFDLAQLSLPYYIASGGKIFFSTGFPNTIETHGSIINFAPVDSLTIYQVTTIDPQTQTILFDNNYPVLEAGSPSPDRVRGIRYMQSARLIYKLPYTPPYDTSRITICLKDLSVNPNVIFLSVPLNRMNFNGNGTIFLRRVLGADFGLF